MSSEYKPIQPVHVRRQEVRNNPRWDKKMKYIRKLKKRGLL